MQGKRRHLTCSPRHQRFIQSMLALLGGAKVTSRQERGAASLLSAAQSTTERRFSIESGVTGRGIAESSRHSSSQHELSRFHARAVSRKQPYEVREACCSFHDCYPPRVGAGSPRDPMQLHIPASEAGCWRAQGPSEQYQDPWSPRDDLQLRAQP